jgi:hypothetical protein
VASPGEFDPRFFERDRLFWPIEAGARAFAGHAAWPEVAEYGERVAHRAEVRFREQPKKPRGRRREPRCARDLYDGRIVEEGWVPTRPQSWHDFLNMLVWAAFPAAKWELHRRQHRAQARRIAEMSGAGEAARFRDLPNARTREQDALALLDEGGILVACRDDRAGEMAAALRERRAADARALFSGGDAVAMIFGHALYEGMVHGHDGAWGAGFLVPCDAATLRDEAALLLAADAALARELLTEGSFATPAALARVDLDVARR